MPEEVPPNAAAHLHDVSAKRLCSACGYDARGIGSPLCPECGTSINWQRLFAPVPGELAKCREVLVAAGVQTRTIETTRPMTPLYPVGSETFGLAGGLWIAAHQAEQAIEALRTANIVIALPLVDVGEPICPTCVTRLDPHDSPPCRSCGAMFQWINVNEANAVGHRVRIPRSRLRARKTPK